MIRGSRRFASLRRSSIFIALSRFTGTPPRRDTDLLARYPHRHGNRSDQCCGLWNSSTVSVLYKNWRFDEKRRILDKRKLECPDAIMALEISPAIASITQSDDCDRTRLCYYRPIS